VAAEETSRGPDSAYLLGVRSVRFGARPPTETGIRPTPSTATEVARAEIARHWDAPLGEKRAVSWGSGGCGLLNPNRRRWVWDPMGEAARVYLCCRFRRFGMATGPVEGPAVQVDVLWKPSLKSCS